MEGGDRHKTRRHNKKGERPGTQSKSRGPRENRGSKQTQKQDWGNRQITNRNPETRGQGTLNNEILNNNKYKIITKIKITN